MGDRVYIELGLKDLLTGAVKRTEFATRNAMGGITKGAATATDKTERLTDAARKMGAGFTNSTNQASNGLKGMGTAADSALQKFNSLGSSVKSSFGGLGNIAGGAFLGGLAAQGVTSAAAGLIGTGKEVLNLGLEAGAMKEQFKVLAGEADGLRLFAELKKYVADSIFGPELYSNARTLLAFGISAKEVMGDMKMLGDVAMGDKEKMDALTLAFAQTTSAGRLMGDDLRQYVGAGFNPLMVLAEKTGKRYEDLKDAMSDGKVSAKMVRDAFVTATSAGGKYYRMLEKMGDTPFGKLQAMQGSFQDMKVGVGETMTESFGRFLDQIKPEMDALPQKMGDVMRGIVPGMEALGKSVLGIVKPIGSIFMSKEFTDLASSTLKLSAAIADHLQPAVKELSRELTGALGGINDLLGAISGKTGLPKSSDSNVRFFEWTADKKERLKREERMRNGSLVTLPVPFFATPAEAQRRREQEKKLNTWAPGWDGGFTAKKQLSDLAVGKSSMLKGLAPANSMGGLSAAAVPKKEGAATAVAKDPITGGGKKVVNIYLNEPMVKQTFQVRNMQEAASVGLREFTEMYLRVVRAATEAI